MYKLCRVKPGLRLHLPSWEQRDPRLSVQGSVQKKPCYCNACTLCLPAVLFSQRSVTNKASKTIRSSSLWAQGSWRYLHPLSADIPSSPEVKGFLKDIRKAKQKLQAETGKRQSKTNFYDQRHKTPVDKAPKSMLILHPEGTTRLFESCKHCFLKICLTRKDERASKIWKMPGWKSISVVITSSTACAGAMGGRREGAEHPLFLKGWAGNEDTVLRLLGRVLSKVKRIS